MSKQKQSPVQDETVIEETIAPTLALQEDKPVAAVPDKSGDHYVEWKVQVSAGKVEKLKIMRACVKISDAQAEVLNRGIEHGGNQIALMYFKPE